MSELLDGEYDSDARRLALEQKLDSQVEVGDGVLLTYAQIVARMCILDGVHDKIPGMPDAVVCDDMEVKMTLAEGHLKGMDAYLASKNPTCAPGELAGRKVMELVDLRKYFGLTFDETVRPNIEGYNWYSALIVATNEEEAAILLMPWMQPWVKGGSPMPVMYTLGGIAIDEVRDIATSYAEYVSRDTNPKF